MIKRKQITVIGLVVVLMGLLLSLDIKGLVKDKGQHSGEAAANASEMKEVTLEDLSATAKALLSSDMAGQITGLENQLKSANSTEKLGLERQLAQKWEDVNQPGPGAFYYELLAQAGNQYSDWLKAGDLFSSAYQSTQDSLQQPGLVAKAINAYQKALALQPNSLDAKTGLGVAYVNGSANPMEGIQLLLGVIKEDPSNIRANMSLGLFSIKTGQFEKAVNRFKTVLARQEMPDAWFYLATCYENMGDKEEAIAAYEKSKALAADPRFSEYVDKRVKELKN